MRIPRLCAAALAALLYVQPMTGESLCLLINPFDDLVDKNTDWIGLAVQATLISDLGRLKGLSVISAEDRLAALKEMEFQLSGLTPDAGQAKIGRLIGASVILSGEYAVSDGEIRITARLINVESGRVLGAAKETGKFEAVFMLQDRLVAALLAELARTAPGLAPPAAPPAAAAPGRSNEFFKALGQGLQAERQGRLKAANAAFRRAYELDRRNPEAVLKLAMNSIAIGELAEARRLLTAAQAQLGSNPAADPVAASRVYFALGWLESIPDNTAEELKWFEAAREALAAGGRPVDQWTAKVIARLGEAYRRHGRIAGRREYFIKAHAAFEEARGHYERLGLTRTIAYADLLRSIGNYYSSQRDNTRAQSQLDEAKRLLEALGLARSAGYAHILWSLADLKRSLRDREAMRQYYDQAVALFEKLGMPAFAEKVRRRSNEPLR